MNLGSPDSTKVKDLRRYLNEFLMDKRVIDMPWLSRLLLVRGIIVPFRAPKSAAAYRSIWWKEGSPLIVISKQLQVAVQQKTTEPVVIAMRYGHPSPQDAFEELLKKAPNIEEVVLLPLYPHYAMSSYETAAEYAKEIHKKKKYPFKLSIVKAFYDDPSYLNAMCDSLQPYLQQEYDHVLFSFHGVPERHIKKSDITHQHCLSSADCCTIKSEAHQYCYRHQCLDTMRQVSEKLGIPSSKYSFSFQSRLGRDPWLEPFTAVRLAQMPAEGIKKLVILCPAFVSDCLETLEEMGKEGREIFLHSGGESFTLVPCMNLNPLWVNAVISLVNNQQKQTSNV